MLRALFALVCLLAACRASAANSPQNTSGGFTAAAEALLAKIPQDKIDRARGFFAPVVKRKQPVMAAFQRDYAAAKNKSEVIVRYLPEAEKALNEARQMKVPPKYEAEKQEYLRIATAFVSSLKVMAAFMQ